MPGNLSGPTLIVILFIVLLLFGAPKLPALARSLGQSMKILKKEVSTDNTDNTADAKTDESKTEPVLDETAQAKADLEQARAEAAAAKAEADALRRQAEATVNQQPSAEHTSGSSAGESGRS